MEGHAGRLSGLIEQFLHDAGESSKSNEVKDLLPGLHSPPGVS